VLLTLINRTIENKLNRYGVINSLKILECFGPYRGDIAELALGKLYSELASINDEEVKTHLDNLRAAAAADLSNQPRPKESGYDRCQWVRDIITPK
jgi:hypothetical protein